MCVQLLANGFAMYVCVCVSVIDARKIDVCKKKTRRKLNNNVIKFTMERKPLADPSLMQSVDAKKCPECARERSAESSLPFFRNAFDIHTHTLRIAMNRTFCTYQLTYKQAINLTIELSAIKSVDRNRQIYTMPFCLNGSPNND